MLGYYGNVEETNKVIKEHKDGNKWLHTGDIGYVTPDGLLYVVGRIKDIIIRYDGKKIYPYNVENILLKCVMEPHVMYENLDQLWMHVIRS